MRSLREMNVIRHTKILYRSTAVHRTKAGLAFKLGTLFTETGKSFMTGSMEVAFV